MKQLLLFLSGIVLSTASLYAQNADTIVVKQDSPGTRKDSLPRALTDSLKLPQTTDSLVNAVSRAPSSFSLRNRFVNIDATPVFRSVQAKKVSDKDSVFYLIAGIVLLLAFLKYLYNRYFTNLFRVFFNTSLRQSQLTDQLLQAKLPSLLFNFFFVLSGGLYLYILLEHYQLAKDENKWLMILFCVALIGLIYLAKYCTLKFTGWVTGLTEMTNIYVFIIFLINKIIGIFLVPFVVVLTFSDPEIAKIALIISLMSIGLFLLLRFFRSYGLLQNQLKISRFHFLLYIAGIELLPLLLIYKGLMIYLSKNL